MVTGTGGTPYSFQGENIAGNRTTISNGGNFTMGSTPYNPEMISSELFLHFDSKSRTSNHSCPTSRLRTV